MLKYIAAATVAVLASQAVAQEGQFKVTLLGTGSPNPDVERAGPSTLVEAGNFKLMIDAGRAATIRLNQMKLPPAKIDAVFFTHFHSDHTIGFPDLWLTGWLAAGGARKGPLSVYGPTGVKTLISGIEAGYSTDINLRAGENFPTEGVKLNVSEFADEGVVFDKDGLKLTAFNVKHGTVKPAVGYRIEYKGKTVVISGDTTNDPNVAKHAMGADLLIHEVMIVRPENKNIPIVKYVMGSHTSPQEAGEAFKKTGVKMAAYTHIIQFGNPPASLDELVRQTRETYDGPLEIGADLTSFEIGDKVVVKRF